MICGIINSTGHNEAVGREGVADMTTQEKIIALSLRLPATLKAMIEDVKWKTRRSQNEAIVDILTEYIKKEHTDIWEKYK